MYMQEISTAFIDFSIQFFLCLCIYYFRYLLFLYQLIYVFIHKFIELLFILY